MIGDRPGQAEDQGVVPDQGSPGAAAEGPRARHLRSMIRTLEHHRTEWFLPVLLGLVRDGLWSLRAYLENPDEADITWEHPAVELQWPVPWDWSRWERDEEVWAGPEPEDFIRQAEAGGEQQLADTLIDFAVLDVLQGLASWTRLANGEEVLYGLILEGGEIQTLLPQPLASELRIPELEAAERHEVLSNLYRPFTFDREGLNRLDPRFTVGLGRNLFLNTISATMEANLGRDGAAPNGRAEEESRPGGRPVRPLEPEFRQAIRESASAVLELLEDPLRFTFHPDEGTPIEFSIRLAVHPFVVNLDERKVYFPALTALVRPEDGRPVDLSIVGDKDKTRLWKTVSEALDQLQGRSLAEVLEDLHEREKRGQAPARGEANEATGGTQEASRATGSAPAVLPSRPKAIAPQRYLLDGSSRLDRATATFVERIGKVPFPKKWASVKRWQDLVRDECDRLQELHGEAAFKPTDQRGPLLIRRFVFTGPKGADRAATRPGQHVVDLTAESEAGLLESLSGRPYRRPIKDDDGVTREYLISRSRVPGGGYIEARVSWYNMAWPLVDSAREDHRKALATEKARYDGTLFELLDPEDQARLDAQLQHVRAIRDGRDLMEYILAVLGRDGRNPVKVPAYELKTLLKCENDPNGMQRVRGCLRALQEIRYAMKVVGGGTPFRSWGPFLGSVNYDPLGRGGGHGDGVFHVQVEEAFIGCLKVFEAGPRIKNARKVMTYDWSKDLDEQDRQQLKGRGYVRAFTSLGVFYDHAKGFTDHQRNLRQWIERELTLNRDGTRKDRRELRFRNNSPGAVEPRIYESSFCPLLPANRRYHGALSHFDHNPENGRTLYGSGSLGTSTSGPKTEGLMAAMGYEVPSGRSGRKREAALRKVLEDLKAVIEEAMGGVVAAFHRGKWYSLEEAIRQLPEPAIGKEARWFLFPAEDWRERLARDFEDHHAGRFARGETPWLPKVTTDREVHRQSLESLHGIHYQEGGPTSDGEPDAADVAPGPVPLHQQLQAVRKARGLTQSDVGQLFGVSKMAISKWEAGPLPDDQGRVRGLPIPAELVPLIWRWLEAGEPPRPEELASRKTRRTGISQRGDGSTHPRAG
jgi:hypothetical protein